MVLVKICGITSLQEAAAAVDAGADFIGFVFAESKRQVTVEQVDYIQRHLLSDVKKVGVFVDTPIHLVNQIAQEVNLDFVQLHGQESIKTCLKSDRPVIKALSLQSDQAMNQVLDYLAVVDYILLDGPKPGSGVRFDWGLINKITQVRSKLMLAGGLTPDNVASAIQYTKPIGVDVSSGVETNGVKDLYKIKQFIHNAKGVR
ncbi:phosphoribosylanthranilate isomerase [Amphibacillus xylanus]|uniref:N-(5'-phosphoribosyl)anthranilate isomerase n=1 Tax=Amphibacillus xylanus (strain ATCC 51415 / DSM 6626 / JCM 7361 / LMG 17667 / NBRC 15112 / Ep01) TaxID=698758 RepID=K0J073_AMPXN|nr:phosphoribosylanthranilate isomerase [Amphibacillus xylanus]BAM48240.1 N-(5'-phosphoribosyl)anthranilate isomerase [Amphibacillus xylanus NBRC 15112]